MICDAAEDLVAPVGCDSLDCVGATGAMGDPGIQGDPGMNGTNGTNGTNGVDGAVGAACWDITVINGTCDLGEDINGDTFCTVADCMGPACWDLNGNLQCDAGTEDMDGDGSCDNDDCQGFTGMYMLINIVAVNVALGPYDFTNQRLCNLGDVATGGGWSFENDVTIGNAQILGSAPVPLLAMPNDPPVGWVGTIARSTGATLFDLTVWAICISDPN